ncbi:hypothetical protein BGX27_006064 [Mortierella sp. AM989]|nr:hypothetical protein BGX27_006064 [Mortierella sp. AM989]
MRFQIIIAAAIAIIATVSAQSNPGFDTPTKECMQCISNNLMNVNSCKGLGYNVDPTTVDPAAKKCACTLAQNLSWLKSCEGPATCSGAFINNIQSSYSTINTNFCAGVDTSSVNSAGGLSIPKAGMVIAIAATAAQALL